MIRISRSLKIASYEKNGLPEGRPPKVAPEGDL